MKRDVTRAWRWFSADDALRWALAAYFQACRELEPPAGDPNPETWSSGGVFAHLFHEAITARICREAVMQKIPCDHGSASAPLGWELADFSGDAGNGLPPSIIPSNNRMTRGHGNVG